MSKRVILAVVLAIAFAIPATTLSRAPHQFVSLQSSPFVSLQSSPCSGSCYTYPDDHPGQYTSYSDQDPEDGNMIRLWREWPDGCTGYYQWDTQAGDYVKDGNGNPVFQWDCCVQVHNQTNRSVTKVPQLRKQPQSRSRRRPS